MADLSYNDVQRAVRDSLQNLQSGVQRLVTGSSTMGSQQARALNDQIRDVREIKQLVQAIRLQLESSSPTVTATTTVEQNPDPVLAEIKELKSRLTNIETYLQQVSQFIANQHHQNTTK